MSGRLVAERNAFAAVLSTPTDLTFDTIAIVPPRIARRFEAESAKLKRVTYWVLPAYAGEFRNGAGPEEFWGSVGAEMAFRWDRSRPLARRQE